MHFYCDTFCKLCDPLVFLCFPTVFKVFQHAFTQFLHPFTQFLHPFTQFLHVSTLFSARIVEGLRFPLLFHRFEGFPTRIYQLLIPFTQFLHPFTHFYMCLLHFPYVSSEACVFLCLPNVFKVFQHAFTQFSHPARIMHEITITTVLDVLTCI